MEFVQVDMRENRDRVYVRARSMDGDDLLAMGDVDLFPDDPEERMKQTIGIEDHSVERYPEGALIAVFAPPDVSKAQTRAPETIKLEPYPFNVELTDFPPEDGDVIDYH